MDFDSLETTLIEAKAQIRSIISALQHPNATSDFELSVSMIRSGFKLIEGGLTSLQKLYDGNTEDPKPLSETFPEICPRCGE